jgi:cardiolipin synthase
VSLDPQTKKLPLILATAGATAAVTLLAVNFSVGEKQITERITHTYTITDPQFQRSIGVLLGPPLVHGNRVDTLVNGREIFPAMLAAIKSARKTVTFETYIYWSGRIGKEFADALADRARSGVRVHVLVDWVGSSRMDSKYLDTMKKAGVEIETSLTSGTETPRIRHTGATPISASKVLRSHRCRLLSSTTGSR